jgi:hypothetical protein
MNRTKTILLSLFALSFLGMMVSICMQEGALNRETIVVGLIGLLMTAIVWLELRRNRATGNTRFIQQSRARLLFVRFIKVVFGGYCAAGGVFIIMNVFDLVFWGGKYENIISENFGSITIILTIVMSMTLMRWLK